MADLLYPSMDNERVSVARFLSIDEATIQLSSLTTIIGPQASGKSIIAKLFYFFRKYQSDLFRIAVFKGEGRPSFNNSKVEEFFEIFGGAERQGGGFEIRYCAGEIEITLSRKSRENRPKISVSKQLASMFTRAKNDFKRFQEEVERKEHEEEEFIYADDQFGYMRSTESRTEFQRSVPSALFIPASRAFFSVIRDEVFTLLSAQKSLDPMMVQFGRIYSNAKRRYERGFGSSRRRKTPSIDDQSEVIGGTYFRRSNKDYIKTSWGEVELPNSSSGQQEALPLIMTLLDYPSVFRRNDLVIIEEPEAHLFPEAQQDIMRLIGLTSESLSTKVLFTTHSPYMLACMNNFLAKHVEVSASAYYLHDGTSEDIFDREENIVELDALDAVSQDIAEEFLELLDE